VIGFTNVNALLGASAIKDAPKAKVPPPVTSDGTPVPEIEESLLPGEGAAAAVLENPAADSPFYGKRCSIRHCREGVQYALGGGPVAGFEPPEDRALKATDSLAAQLEAALYHARPGVQVEVSETRYLCLRHYHELEAARAAKIAEYRKAQETPSWHLSELNWTGARVELVDSTWFDLWDGDGKYMRLEVAMLLDEVQARMAGKEWRPEVLNPAQAEHFAHVAKTKAMADRVIAEAIVSKAV